MPRSPEGPDTAVRAAIRGRRSVRRFKSADPSWAIRHVLEAGRWAPSGLNNQPWRFLVVKDPLRKRSLARLTSCGTVIRSAPVLIAVCLDHRSSYHREKDLMAIGACIQNMLLEADALDLGTCWLGEILNQRQRVEQTLGIGRPLEFLALIALGTPLKKPGWPRRKPLEKLMLASRNKS